MRVHEVIIIGGSLAGASCAAALGRLGVDVAVFERQLFPRQKVCGELLSPGAVRHLGDLGVLDEIVEAGAVRVGGVRLRARGQTLEIPFPAPALGFSRERLDTLLAGKAGVEHGCGVEGVRKSPTGFVVTAVDSTGARFEVSSRVVVDAAGKLSRFTRRLPVAQYGVQYHEAGDNGSVLDFKFFEGGYGGVVSVEGRRKNSCFLVERHHVERFRRKEGCVVTGHLAYQRVGGDYLAIGDAAGMVDPFCGEGMRHALQSGLLAAAAVSDGLRTGLAYDAIRERYNLAWKAAWFRKRTVAAGLRSILASRPLAGFSFALSSRFPKLVEVLLRELWR